MGGTDSTVKVSKPTRNRAGKHGVHVSHVHSAHGWDGQIAFSTHGMTAAQTVTEHERLKARHTRKAEKMNSLSALVGQRIGDFTITDATIRDAGSDIEVLIRAKDSGGVRAEVVRYFGDPASIPLDGWPLQWITERINAKVAEVTAADAHASEIRQALGL